MEALQGSPQNRYLMLWRYIGRARSGDAQAASEELLANAARLKEQRWPEPVIDFYLGKIDEAAMQASAESTDPKKRSEQICEANFYAAQKRILSNAPGDVLAGLRAAEKDCPRTFIEAHGASAELKRLGF